MSTLTLATSVSRNNILALSTTTVQTLSEKKEALTQRVEALRAELQALRTAHATTITSFQAEQKKWNSGVENLKGKNFWLQVENNELTRKVILYQRAENTHICPAGRFKGILNASRATYREQGKPLEWFWHLI
ncbi:MAG: hypothetical protein Q8L98_08690 [Chlamydiales bacterium]|nr:hypothetical protein [Chlamydiales bacterium]